MISLIDIGRSILYVLNTTVPDTVLKYVVNVLYSLNVYHSSWL